MLENISGVSEFRAVNHSIVRAILWAPACGVSSSQCQYLDTEPQSLQLFADPRKPGSVSGQYQSKVCHD
jgi:hypothetical protein